MLEGPLKSWICYFLGQYVESEHVIVSAKLWNSSERLKLENLALKPSIIPSWLPFRLKTGFIGQFEADLPMSAIFGNAAAKIKFMDVLIVLSPLQHDESEQQEEIDALLEQKRQNLEQDLHDRWNGPQVPEYTVPHESEGYFGTDGWIGRTMTKLIDNLQIDIRNLHIRIEGNWFPTSPMHSPPGSLGVGAFGPRSSERKTGGVKFAAGITLGALSAVTTPSNWRIDGFDDEKPVPPEKNHLVFKLINALDLSAYVDPNTLHFIHSSVHPRALHATLTRLKEMGSKTARVDWWKVDESVHAHRFLIAPISVTLKLTMNTAAQHAQTNDPRYGAVFHLSRVVVGLDEDQLSILNLILDSYSRHEQWRIMVSDYVKANERNFAADAVTMELTAETYLLLWKQVVRMKKEGVEGLKKTEIWNQIVGIETNVPYELIVSLRNRGGMEEVAGAKSVPYASFLHEMGDAMGIPLPEICVSFAVGPTGLILEAKGNGDVAVKRCVEKSPASAKDAVKAGLLLIKIDGKPVRSMFRFKSGSDLQMEIDQMPGTRVLTFRHPMVKAPEVTPSRLVSKVSFDSDALTFRLVRAVKKTVIAEIVLNNPMVLIKGYGPDLFSYHCYESTVGGFYIKRHVTNNDEGNNCIASSICHPLDQDHRVRVSRPALYFQLNYLHDGHPDAVPDIVSSYGSKISCTIGNSILVFDEPKMAALLTEWSEFTNAISSQYSEHPSFSCGNLAVSSSSTVTIPPSDHAYLSSSAYASSRSNVNIPDDVSPEVATSSYSYDIRLDHLRFFISAAKKTEVPAPLATQPSYRTILKQLVVREPVDAPTHPDWMQATRAIIVMQRFIRGAIVRKRRMIRSALTRSRWQYYQGDEMMGWLFTRDDTLAFRRWRRSWCHVDEDGNFSVHDNGSGTEQRDQFSLAGCNVIMLPNARKCGPFGENGEIECCILEISTHSGVLRKVLSSDSRAELEKWKACIESSARNASKRLLEQHDEEFEDDDEYHEMDGDDYDYDDNGGFAFDNEDYESDTDAADELSMKRLLLGGFSDIYRSSAERKAAISSWITLSVTDFFFLTDVHRVSEPEQSAFQLFISVRFLTIVDHRKGSAHGLLHIGDEFLNLKHGVLTPAKLRADHRKKGPSLLLKASYRGALTTDQSFIAKKGLNIDLDISGWIMLLNLTELIFEIVDILDILWTDPTADKPDETMSPNVVPDPWYKVSELGIQIRAPILEAYLADSHCVAKLSIEKSTFGYRADPGMENAKVHLGPTALFVLTDEVALRLAQVDKLWLNYDLRLVKFSEQPSNCKLCLDENAKRPMGHRSIHITAGQVKLEADRRLELLFALVEALTETDTVEEENISSNEEEFEDEMKTDRISGTQKEFESLSFLNDRLPSERMQSMQFNLHDQEFMELRPMYATTFGRRYNGSPTARSRISTATSAGLNNYQSRDDERRPRSTVSSLIPLLNYQTYFAILPDLSERHGKLKTLFRVRLRVGRMHDHIHATCYSVVFEVIKRSLSVVALDTYIPVMNFSLSDMKLQVLTRSEFSADYVLDASVEISARYYNTALADWEPFIEPWRAYAKVRSDQGGGGETSMELSAMQRLNINFTDALVRLLCSVTKNRRKQVFYVEKRTPAAVAADVEAKKEDGRVCVLNNLGVPIRLANLNTSHAGTLHVEVRDGWSSPSYSRFHDVRVEVVLLPWWHPCEAKKLESLAHKFSLPYGGAQSGVTPILRIDVSSTERGKRNFVFDHISDKYVEVEEEEDEESHVPLSQPFSGPHLSRRDSSGSTREKWYSIGTVEINLAGSVMGSLGSNNTKLNRWYRIHDVRGNITGEIFVALEFEPQLSDQCLEKSNEPDQVKDGQFLVFDPLKILGASETSSKNLTKMQSAKGNLASKKEQVVLSDALRTSYIPPLALEVFIGSKRCSLLCPLRRAGKFLIQGENVLVEVKVAQRDESRRVLLLSSPVQLKNDTSLDMELWTCRTHLKPGEGGVLPKPEKLMLLTTNNKISVPLSAMFGEEKQSIIVKVDGCKATVVSCLDKLKAGFSILILEPEEDQIFGYCVYVNVASFMRKVYREDYQDVVTRGNSHNGTEVQSYATKYQICFHSCLVFENTLPIRVRYKIVTQRSGYFGEITLRTGTLAPGEEVHIHEFEKNAQLYLQLPDMDSMWTRPISLGDCIFREGMDRPVKSMLGAIGLWDPVLEFKPSFPQSDFETEDLESKKVVARLDYTAADDGSPRVVLYCSLWIYNQSHVQTLSFRCADEINAHVVHVPQLVQQRAVPRLMDCPHQVFEMSTTIEHEISRWSDKIHSNVVGIQAPISLKFGRKLGPRTRNEIGISIQRPLGQFHRTTQVVVTSRFVFVNKTNAPFKISQHGKDSDRVMELLPSENGVPTSNQFDFDVSGNALTRGVYLRMNHNGAEWSGPFSVDEEKEFPLKLRGGVGSYWKSSAGDGYERPGFRLCDSVEHRLKIRIHSIGASMVVTLTRDDPPMFVICNESSLNLYVHQVDCSDHMMVVRNKEFVPFAWVKPDGVRRVVFRAGAPDSTHPASRASRVYDFTNLDRERGREELKFWLHGKQLKTVSADIVVDRSSRVLVFRDHNPEKPPSYILEVKIVSARLNDKIPLTQDAVAEFVAETDNHAALITQSKELKTAHVYRFDSDLEFSCESRPKKLLLNFFDGQRDNAREGDDTEIGIGDEMTSSGEMAPDVGTAPGSPMAGDESGPFEMMETPVGSPSGQKGNRHGSGSLTRHQPFYHSDSSLSLIRSPLHFSEVERVSQSYASSENSDGAEDWHVERKEPSGLVEIRIPKKAWTRFSLGSKRSIAWSYNNSEQANRSLGRVEGHWWEIRHPETGDIIGEVQIALKFRTSVQEYVNPTNIFNVSVHVPSVGISFLHNNSSTLVEVAYLSLQRMGMLYSCVGNSSEVVFAVGNLQMDNQMDAEVVLGPKVYHVKEGVSVRLRDRWRSCLNYRYRGLLDQLETTSQSAIQFRMMWNSRCNAGEITHYELIELVMQELEVSTDEKFVVNLITVFQGLETLTTQHEFEDIVDTSVDYTSGGSGAITTNSPNTGGSTGNAAEETQVVVSDGVYIEELDIEAIRITFNLELNGGRYIKTLGPSGRRLAVYMPESNLKDFHLYLPKLTFNHLYETKASVAEKLTKRYQQQAVRLVLSGLHTVSVYANPIRIIYRLGHGLVEIVRLPARGLASGSPLELLSGAYLGVRSLAMNTISASYEIVAGAAGLLTAMIGPLLPESKRKAFEDDMIAFQRAVIEEVDSFDAAEERTMNKQIVRKPREFHTSGVGLLTVYGPGALPMEEQDRIDQKAVLVIQQWWRRRRRANLLYAEALRQRPDIALVDTSRMECIIL